MKPPADQPSPLRRFVAAIALLHLLAAMALAASPRLHQWVHPDEADDDADCAIVQLQQGAVDVPAVVLVLAATVTVAVIILPARTQAAFVPSIFARGGVFEHAPPRRWRTSFV